MEDLKKEVVKAGRKIKEKGLIAGTWGNISLRSEKNPEKFVITPSGMNYSEIEKDDIVVMKISGEKIEGDKEPSTEAPLHKMIYHERRDENAIIHTHSNYATAIACNQKDIPSIVEDMIQIIGGKIECADYALPGTEKLAKNAIKALKDKKATLLSNHGAIAIGNNLEEALTVAEIIEKSAKIFTYSKLIGEPNILSDEDIEKMKDMVNF